MISSLAVFIESYLFPALFLYFIYHKLEFFVDNWARFPLGLQKAFAGHWDTSTGHLAIGALATFFVIVLDACIFYGLILRRNLKRGPQGFQEIFIPLLGSSFYLTYNFAEHFPQAMNLLLVPPQSLGLCAVIGTLVNMCGAVISIVATYNLKYSYGVFVQLRDIMTRGLYRFVRHPIYLGYTLSTMGFLLMLPRLSYLVIFVGCLVITVYRAKLEEKKLSASSEYQAYCKRTPFLFPRLK